MKKSPLRSFARMLPSRFLTGAKTYAYIPISHPVEGVPAGRFGTRGMAAAPAGGFVPRAREAPQAVRRHYDRLTSMAGRRRERRSGGSRFRQGAQAPGPARKHGAGDRKAAVERRTATRFRKARRKAGNQGAPFGAPPPRTRGASAEAYGAPAPQRIGAMMHACILATREELALAIASSDVGVIVCRL